MRKGQAAMEFLMTYGWAILVVLAAIGALAYFGVLSPSKFVPDRCTFRPGFEFRDCKVGVGTSGLQFTMLNGLGVDIKNVSVTVNTTGSSDVQCNAQDSTTQESLANGAISSVFALCDTSSAAEGWRFDADVKVEFVRSGESLAHTVVGEIKRRIEP